METSREGKGHELIIEKVVNVRCFPMIVLMLACELEVHITPRPFIVSRTKLKEGRFLTFLQVTIATTMVGLVEGMLYAHRAGLDVPS